MLVLLLGGSRQLLVGKFAPQINGIYDNSFAKTREGILPKPLKYFLVSPRVLRLKDHDAHGVRKFFVPSK